MKPAALHCPVLLYHSQNVAGNDYASNDHVALAADLRMIHRLGLQVIPLAWLVEWLLGERDLNPENCVCISFDDGVDSDVRDLDFPQFGLQRGFLNIMLDFRAEFGSRAQPCLHATSFVIASPEARAVMDKHSLFDQGWMNEDWWRTACDNELLAIANHGWDHEHPDLVHIGGTPAGDFLSIDSKDKADGQIFAAGEYIASVTGGHWPGLFAYPYGQVSDYLCSEYFPGHEHHRTRAAFTTEPKPITADSDQWQLGRYVCGRDWRSDSDLKQILLSSQ
jgi:hypothetical protein